MTVFFVKKKRKLRKFSLRFWCFSGLGGSFLVSLKFQERDGTSTRLYSYWGFPLTVIFYTFLIPVKILINVKKIIFVFSSPFLEFL